MNAFVLMFFSSASMDMLIFCECHNVFNITLAYPSQPLNFPYPRMHRTVAGKNRRTSTKEESLSKAKEIAEDWYLRLRGKLRDGEIKSEKTFREVSEHYLHEYEIMTQGQRNKK